MAVFHNGKLERGSYFYIAVGELYFKGMAPEIVEREIKPQSTNTWRDFTDFRTRFLSVKKRRNTNWRRASMAPKKIVREHTGRTLYEWTDKLEEAKQFRVREKANETCRILKRNMTNMDAEPVVHLHERKVA